MRVLLTGASGFIGSHVLKAVLQRTDWTVVCPVSFQHKGLPERFTYAVAPKHESRVEIIRCDLSCPIGFTTARLFGKVEAVINLASDTHPPRSVTHPVEVMQNNTNLMLHLLEYARTLALRAFIQISTDAVYGDALTGAHKEWSPTSPQNVYAASKAAQEALAIAYWRSYGIPVIIATTMNPIGEMQYPEKFIPSTISKVLRDEMVTVHASLDGTLGRRTYIDVKDVADALLFLVEHQPATRYPNAANPDRWNITGPRELNNLEVVKMIATNLGRVPMTIVEQIDQADLGHRYALDGSKLAEAGWVPSPSIERALERIVRWTSENRLWLA